MAATPPRRVPGWLLPAAVFLLPVALYLPTLRYGFVFDDGPLIVSNPAIRDPSRMGEFFKRDLDALWRSSDAVSSNYYRPLFLVTLTLGRAVAGADPAAWHALVVALHGLAALLALFALRAQGLSARAAAAAAVLGAFHPAHVSSVAWVSGLQDVLAGVTGLAAFLAYRRYAPAGGGRSGRAVWLVATALAYAAALASKEVAVALALFVAGEWAWRLAIARDRDAAAATARALAVLAAVTAGYLALRLSVLGTLFQPFATAPAWPEALASVPRVAAAYLRALAWPAGLFMLSPVRPVGSWSSPSALAGLVALAAGAAGVALLVRRRPQAFAPTWWAVAWLLPCLNLRALNPEWIVVDRYLYLPALAVPWLLAWPWTPAYARTRRVLVPAVAVAFAALSLAAMRHFRDPHTFWARALAADPTSSMAWTEEARLRGEGGDAAGARRALERAIALDPASLLPRLRLTNLDLAEGRPDVAARSLAEIVVRNPGYVPAWRNLPTALARAGDEPGALARAREAAERFPRDPEILGTYAILLRRAGQVEPALQVVRAAARLAPGDGRLALREAVLLAELGRRSEAAALVETRLGTEEDPAIRRELEGLRSRLRSPAR